MGMFSWFSSTGRKSAAAAAIQAYFELSKRHGLFPLDPARVANRIVATACERVKGLERARYRHYVLAAACLSIMLMEHDEYTSLRPHYALALAAVLQATLMEPDFSPTYAEAKIIKGAQMVLESFHAEGPQVNMNLVVTAAASDRASPNVSEETSRDHERRMDELIKRMRNTS